MMTIDNNNNDDDNNDDDDDGDDNDTYILQMGIFISIIIIQI